MTDEVSGVRSKPASASASTRTSVRSPAHPVGGWGVDVACPGVEAPLSPAMAGMKARRTRVGAGESAAAAKPNEPAARMRPSNASPKV
ncbi:MAG: hypothetical protein IPO51_07645 [Dehalococcoidia bacterium]|nr:hypothetical protein [Dehalococcoidia bacterium]